MDIFELGLGHMFLVGHDHIARDLGQVGAERFQQRHESQIHEHVFVFRMVDHINDLLVKKPWIYGVANRAHAGDGEVKLEMAIVVPGDGGDTVAPVDAEARHRLGQLLRAPVRIGQCIAVDRPLRRARDNL